MLSILCLLIIAGIILFGFLKARTVKETIQINNPDILGEVVESNLLPTAESNVRGVVQDVWKSSKQEVNQRMETVRTEVMQSIQKEVSSLTQ